MQTVMGKIVINICEFELILPVLVVIIVNGKVFKKDFSTWAY